MTSVVLEACAIYETSAMLSALDRDGCVLVRQALSAEQCAHARTRIDALRPLHWDEVHCENERGTRFLDLLAHTGDALVFRSDVCHEGSDNRTAHDVRYLLQVHYARREMAQHFSPYMDWRFAPDVLAAASKRQRRLLGDHEPGAYD